MHLAELLQHQFAEPGTSWAIGTFAAIAEFHRATDEPVTLSASSRIPAFQPLPSDRQCRPPWPRSGAGTAALVTDLISDGALVAPFRNESVTDRAYFIVRTPAMHKREEVDAFVNWLIAESTTSTRTAGQGTVTKRAKR